MLFLVNIIATVSPLILYYLGSCYHSRGEIIPLLANNIATVFLFFSCNSGLCLYSLYGILPYSAIIIAFVLPSLYILGLL